jgi:hypothetical protein
MKTVGLMWRTTLHLLLALWLWTLPRAAGQTIDPTRVGPVTVATTVSSSGGVYVYTYSLRYDGAGVLNPTPWFSGLAIGAREASPGPPPVGTRWAAPWLINTTPESITWTPQTRMLAGGLTERSLSRVLEVSYSSPFGPGLVPFDVLLTNDPAQPTFSTSYTGQIIGAYGVAAVPEASTGVLLILGLLAAVVAPLGRKAKSLNVGLRTRRRSSFASSRSQSCSHSSASYGKVDMPSTGRALFISGLLCLTMLNCARTHATRGGEEAGGDRPPAPRIRRVAADRQTVPRYGRVELSVDLQATYQNPFDPDQVAVEARFRGPSGRERMVPGFWYQRYRRELAGNTERVTPAGEPGWRVRFAPEEVGRYTYRVMVRDPSGEARSAEGAFTAVASHQPGFIRVSRESPLHFAFDDGAPYFPIGANVCWSGSRGTYDYDDWFAKYAVHGCNYARLWLGPFDLFTLERTMPGKPGSGLGRYDLANAWRLDTVLERAERDGLRLMFCLESFNALRIRPPYALWDRNPYKAANGGPIQRPEQFFTDEGARRLFRQRLRYLVARWGYSTHLLAWEFWNEVDIIEKYVPADVRDWHMAMSRALREMDPWKHLQTTSFAGSAGDAAIDGLPEMQFVQTHRYGPQDMAGDLPRWCLNKTRAYKKPHFVGEFGADADGPRGDADPTGIQLHNGIWSTALSPSAGTAMLWWWDNYIDPKNLYPQFRALAAFLRGVDWPRARLAPLGAATMAFQSPPAGPEYRDLLLTSNHGSWEPAPYNQPQTFGVERSGRVANDNLPRILHGRRNHPDLHNPATFEVDYPQAGSFIARVEGVSGYGGAGLEIWLDGKRLLARDFPDPDGNTKTETLRQYAGDYTIEVPAGRHTIRVVNPGADWLEISYRLPSYATTAVPPLRVLGMQGPALALVWAQNLDHTWYKRSLGTTLRPVAATKVTLGGFAAGDYEIELWDTYRGAVIRRGSATAREGRLQLALPPVEKDVAVKILRRA